MLLGVFPIAMWLQGSVDKVTNPLNSDLQSKTGLEVTLFPIRKIAEKKVTLLEGSGGELGLEMRAGTLKPSEKFSFDLDLLQQILAVGLSVIKLSK